MVVRTEHLWEDLSGIEHLLGGNASVRPHIYPAVTHGSEKFQLKANLSSSAAQDLCCAVEEEVKIYVDLLNQAVNLNNAQRKESILHLKRYCNITLCT